MTGLLPKMKYSSGIRKLTEVKFKGYHHTLGASGENGELYHTQNLTSDHYPLIASRKPRVQFSGIFDGMKDFYSYNGKIYYIIERETNDVIKIVGDEDFSGTLEKHSHRSFALMNSFLIIFPDKVYIDTLAQNAELQNMEVSISGRATISDGTYAQESAELNTITFTDISEIPFREGDAVAIEGFSNPDNNLTVIIREINGNAIGFYENTFAEAESGEKVTLTRAVPDMDFICEQDNRLWGCRGDTIYGSKLGDHLNFSVFDGIASDSYSIDAGSAGDFTACAAYLGYVIFFKEEGIYKLYGSKPSNFQLIESAALGVESGSSLSLAIASEVLFYKSRVGIMAYSGGVPRNISSSFGDVRYKNAVGGSDGVKYYVSMITNTGDSSLFVYDTRFSIWLREDDTSAKRILYDGRLFILGHTLFSEMLEGEKQEETVSSIAEFADFTEGAENKKGTAKLQMRAELDAGTSLTVYIRFDGGEWETVKSITADIGKKRSFYLPIVPRRADHLRLKIEAEGSYRLHSLTRESYEGSEQ